MKLRNQVGADLQCSGRGYRYRMYLWTLYSASEQCRQMWTYLLMPAILMQDIMRISAHITMNYKGATTG